MSWKDLINRRDDLVGLYIESEADNHVYGGLIESVEFAELKSKGEMLRIHPQWLMRVSRKEYEKDKISRWEDFPTEPMIVTNGATTVRVREADGNLVLQAPMDNLAVIYINGGSKVEHAKA